MLRFAETHKAPRSIRDGRHGFRRDGTGIALRGTPCKVRFGCSNQLRLFQQINGCGERAVRPYDGLEYWDYNWRKGGGSSRMIEISKREEFYMQEYCGCVYSLRDTNRHRREVGRGQIELGKMFYGNDSDE